MRQLFLGVAGAVLVVVAAPDRPASLFQVIHAGALQAGTQAAAAAA
jgi:hypothetical protein